MRIFKVGDKGRAICDSCKSVKVTTYKLRDVPLSDKSDIVKNVLVGVCDTCDAVCALPQQSLPLVQQTIRKNQRDSVEVRLSQPADDIFSLACTVLDVDRNFRSTLVRYYTKHMLGNPNYHKISIDTLLQLNHELIAGTKVRRMSLKGVGLHHDLKEFKSLFHIQKDADWVNTIAIKVKEEIVDQKRPEMVEQLRCMASACN